MQPLKYKLSRYSLQTMYESFVLPIMQYAYIVWGGSYDTDMIKLEKIHIDGMRLVTGATAHSNTSLLYTETSWPSSRDRCNNAMLVMLYKI